jgi:hypothetical protein
VAKAILISAVPPLIMRTDATLTVCRRAYLSWIVVLSTGLSGACLSAA